MSASKTLALARELARQLDPASSTCAEQLEAALTRVVEDAHKTWPDLEVDDHDFVIYLAERLPSDQAAEKSLAAVRAGDLFLASACVRGDLRGQRHFLELFGRDIERSLRRAGVQPETIGDEKQRVLAEVLAPRAQKPMALAGYSGQGSLRAWVGVVSSRIVYGRRKTPVPEDLSVELFEAVGESAELAYVRKQYKDAARAALSQSLTALTPDERNLLRHRFIDELTLKELASLYGLHSSTVMRQIRDILDRVLCAARSSLRDKLGAGDETIESIFTAVHQHLDSVVERELREGRPPES